MKMAQEAFKISDEAMRPTSCPACGYSWQGLPEPRCPECGERVKEGEVVVVGLQMLNSGRLTHEHSWLQEMACWVGITMIVGLTLVKIKGMDVAIVIICAVMLALFMLFSAWRRWSLLRHGIPPGTLRISSDGYCFGAGETIGRMRRWSSVGRIVIRGGTDGVVRIRESVMWGWITLKNRFEIVAACTPEQVAGIQERLHVWGVKDIKVIFKKDVGVPLVRLGQS